MSNIRDCVPLVGFLGLFVACGSPSPGNGRTSGLGQGGKASLGEGDQTTAPPSEGGSFSSSLSTNTDSASPPSGAAGNESTVGGANANTNFGASTAVVEGTGGTAALGTGGVAPLVGVGGSSGAGLIPATGGVAASTSGGVAVIATGGVAVIATGGVAVIATGGVAATGGANSAEGGSNSTVVGGSPNPPDPDFAKSQCAGKRGPSYDQFFDEGKLATLRVTIDPAVLQGQTPLDALWVKWAHCPPYDASRFLPASFAYESPDSVGNVTCENVGMRLRGSRERDSIYSQVRGFKLDMQVLDTGAATHRRFADLNRINILSIEMDDKSHMMQCLAYKAMREFKIPAPRCNHLKVYVNDAYYGLLENIEQVNRGYVRRHFGTNAGYLFAASPSQEDCTGEYAFKDSQAKLNYSGDAFSSYTAQYMLDSATPADAERTLIPMMKCGDATQNPLTPDEAPFKACIQEWIDVDEWLRFIAADSLMPELQSWLGYYRNGYLYFRPDASAPHGGRFAIWSWDLDTAYNTNTCYPATCDPFKAVDGLYGPRNARSKLIQRLTNAFKGEYCTLLKSFLATVYQPSLVDNMATVIEAGVAGDSHTDPTAWQASVSALHDYFISHGEQMQTLVNTSCP